MEVEMEICIKINIMYKDFQQKNVLTWNKRKDSRGRKNSTKKKIKKKKICCKSHHIEEIIRTNYLNKNFYQKV